MGVFDKFAGKVAKAIVGTHTDLVPMARAMASPNSDSIPLGAGLPLMPYPINFPSENGQVEPRKWEYQVGANINVNAIKLVPFEILRAAADQIDLLSRCIYTKKSKMLGVDWDIVLTDDATDKIMREQNVTREQAGVIAREEFNDEISRIKDFWKAPDKVNGLTFLDWYGLCLDEVLTIDALAIYPQTDVNGELLGFQIIDGGTIKPLIDDRGMRPQPPDAAFQQILYGFPRSDFLAPDENEKADGVFLANELSYSILNRRTTSMFGLSPVERSLVIADIYMRRQEWTRGEYTLGVTSDVYMTTDASFSNNPDVMNAFERNFNDNMRGQDEARHGVKLLPIGMEPIQLASYAERFANTLDDYLITTIASHFAIQPSELGLSPKSGLGSSGQQEGQAASSEVIGDVPLAKWFQTLFSNLSYLYLGMPREIEFKFITKVRQDEEVIARADDINMKNGKKTINEARAEAGKPLIQAVEADQPIFVTSAGAFFITDAGVVPFGKTAEEFAKEKDLLLNPPPVVVADPNAEVDEKPKEKPVETDETKAQEELKSFVRWLRKSPTRPFNFEAVPTVYSEVLNKFVDEKDYDTARWYAERYMV